MYSFGCDDNFMMILVFYMKLVNNKVLDNLLICHVQKFHGCRPNDLRVIPVRRMLSDLLVLCTDLKD